MQLNAENILALLSLIVIIGVMVLGIQSLARREGKLKTISQMKDENWGGAAALPEGAEQLATTDETDGSVKQGGIWLHQGNLFISRSLLAGNADMLTAFYQTPYLRIFLPGVVECSVDFGGTAFRFSIYRLPISVIVALYIDDKKLYDPKKLVAALQAQLKCPVESLADLA